MRLPLPRRVVLLAACLLLAAAGVLAAGAGRHGVLTAHAQDPATSYTPPFTGCAYKSAKAVRGGPTTGKRIALTFDDGPSTYTAKVLDILADEGIPATFFIQGNRVAGREDLLRRALDEGHMLGNHSFTHADLTKSSVNLVKEVEGTQETIADATGFTPCIMRPPYGRTSPRLLQANAANHLATIIWNDNPIDYTRPGSAKIRSVILKGAKPGGIIICHDGGGNRSQTVAALPGVIETLKARGYRFVTVTSLLGLCTAG